MKSLDEFIDYTEWNIFFLRIWVQLGRFLEDEKHAELFVIVIVDIMLATMADIF